MSVIPGCALGFIACLALGAVSLAAFSFVFCLEDLQYDDDEYDDEYEYDEYDNLDDDDIS